MKKHALLVSVLAVMICLPLFANADKPDNDKNFQVKVTKVERHGKEVIVHFKVKNTGEPAELKIPLNDQSYLIGKNGKKYKTKKIEVGHKKSSRLVGRSSNKIAKNAEVSCKAIFDVPDDINEFKLVRIYSKDKFTAQFKNVKTHNKTPVPKKQIKPSSTKVDKSTK